MEPIIRINSIWQAKPGTQQPNLPPGGKVVEIRFEAVRLRVAELDATMIVTNADLLARYDRIE